MSVKRAVGIAAAATMALSVAGAIAAAPAQTALRTKLGKSNVQVLLILHPQVDQCAAPLLKEVRRQALRLGVAHVRQNLPALIRKAGTDASGETEFFGVSYLVGCPRDGTAWIAFPAVGTDKTVTRYAPGLGWSAMMKL